MTIKKRILSLVLTITMLTTIAPWSAMKVSASFTGALQFNSDGKFTVLQLADIQDDQNVDARVIAFITNAIARYNPDLVVFTGDNQKGTQSSSNFQSSVNGFLQPLINTNTKFAVTFGNHDAENNFLANPGSKDTQYNYYMSHGGSLAFDHDVDALTGAGSGVIPIYPNGQTSGTPAFQIYLMDSGDAASSGYNCPYTDQIDYYIQRSLLYPDVPSLWYMHIIVPDVYTKTMVQVPSGTANSYAGSGTPYSSSTWALDSTKINWAKSGYGTTLSEIYKEPPCPANQATYESTAHRSSASYGSKTLYESWVAYGNMLGSYYGHDHKNSFVTTTSDGIDIGYGKAPTLNSYNDGNPGSRIFELDANGTYNTFNVTESDLAKVNINFNANGGTGFMLGQLITKNTAAALSSNTFTRTGYTFAGWATTAAGSVSYNNGANYSIGTADVTLYAKWNSNVSYNITFDAGGGLGGTGPTAMLGGSALSAPVVTKTGFTFNGWSPAVPSTVPFADTTYTAQWTPINYTITFDANGGIGGTSPSVAYGTMPIAPAVTRVGYTFTSWSPAIETVTGAATYTAQWTPNNYTITFDANGGIGGTTPSVPYGATPEAPIVTRIGCTFDSWSPAIAAVTGAATYTAQWKPINYTITFDANGGIGGTTPSVPYGTMPQAPIVTKEGYTFASWSPAIETVTGVATYTAQWTINQGSITFNSAGGSAVETITQDYGSAVTAPEHPIKEGYTFTGWLPEVPSTMPANATNCVAQWTPINYTITFDANGGIGGTTPSVAYGTTPEAPIVTREGYTIESWTPAIEKVTGPATYTALWTLNCYTINFDANGGIGGTTPSVPYGTTPESPVVTREGYSFDSWSPAIEMVTGTAKYTAVWSINSYTITFDINGGIGTEPATQTDEFGSQINMPAKGDIAKQGYIFLGWATTPNAEIPLETLTVPAVNTTLYAVWRVNPVLVIHEGSTTVIDEVNNIIYGLEPGLTQDDFRNRFVDTNSNSSLVFIPANGIIGTGTQIQLIDNTTKEVIQTFTVLIFGDVNGDGNIDNIDAGVFVDIENEAITWDLIANALYFKAADLNGDGNIDSMDASIAIDFENGLISIDQTGVFV